MKQNDIKNLATMYSLLPEDAIVIVLNMLVDLERLTGCKWYPDCDYLIDAQNEREARWEKPVEIKENVVSGNSLMF